MYTCTFRQMRSRMRRQSYVLLQGYPEAPHSEHKLENMYAAIRLPWRESCFQKLSSRYIWSQLAADGGNQLVNRREAFYVHQFWYVYRTQLAHPPKIIPYEVDDHQILAEIFLICSKVVSQCGVFLCGFSSRCGTFDGFGLYPSMLI